MILRKKISFLIPVLLAGFILYCGMNITDALLEKQMDSVIGEQGKIMLPAILDDMNDWDQSAEESFADMAKSYSEGREWLLHDPVSGQLSMDEALAVSGDAVDSFIRAGILPDDFQDILACSYKAVLGTREYQNSPDAIISPRFSWWDIRFSGSDVLLEVYLNAVTGKIMKLTANMGEKQENSIDFHSFIAFYLEYLEIPDAEYELEKTDSALYVKLPELNLLLVIEISNLDDDNYYGINLYFE